jgi:hypothetical protein
MPKKKQGEATKTPSVNEVQDQWPYGLQLRFESEQVDKLPQLEKMEIGERVMVNGIGEVTSIRMSEKKQGKKDWSVEIQIQKIGIDTVETKRESMGDAIKRYQKGD